MKTHHRAMTPAAWRASSEAPGGWRLARRGSLRKAGVQGLCAPVTSGLSDRWLFNPGETHEWATVKAYTPG